MTMTRNTKPSDAPNVTAAFGNNINLNQLKLCAAIRSAIHHENQCTRRLDYR
jgi:hypothetical protein